MSDSRKPLVRWRLALGEHAQLGLGPGCSLDGDDVGRDDALSWLYDREPDFDERDVRRGCQRRVPLARPAGDSEGERRGGHESSVLTVPRWIDAIHRLFPKETIERLERDAVERYRIDEVVTNPDVLRRVEPNEALLEAVLRTKHLMNAEVLALARELVAKVVRDLMEKLAKDVKQSFSGARERRASSVRVTRNFDAKRTIKENLAHFSPGEKRLYIRAPRFFSRTRRHAARWRLVLLVDESGSMLGSVVHAAVTAACLWGLPALETHLCIFDTEVVDLTQDVTDPVEVLMKVQLGGGTDIAKAVAYAQGLIENPRRTIVVLLTDFFEGGDAEDLVRRVHALVEQGTIVLGLAALDEQANPSFDRDLAGRLVAVGAQVGAMTPGELASWIASKVRA